MTHARHALPATAPAQLVCLLLPSSQHAGHARLHPESWPKCCPCRPEPAACSGLCFLLLCVFFLPTMAEDVFFFSATPPPEAEITPLLLLLQLLLLSKQPVQGLIQA